MARCTATGSPTAGRRFHALRVAMAIAVSLIVDSSKHLLVDGFSCSSRASTAMATAFPRRSSLAFLSQGYPQRQVTELALARDLAGSSSGYLIGTNGGNNTVFSAVIALEDIACPSDLVQTEAPTSQEGSAMTPPYSRLQDSFRAAALTQDLEYEQVKQEAEDRTIVVARLLLIGAAALYGTNFALVKVMSQNTELSIGVSTTLRFGLASIATLPWLFSKSSDTSETKYMKEEEDSLAVSASTGLSSDDILATTVDAEHGTLEISDGTSEAWGAFLGGFEVGIWGCIGYISQAVGLETTLASQSAFLCSLAVVVVPFLDFLAGRNLKAREWMGALLALAGVALLEFGTAEWVTPTWTYGDYASMVQPFAFGIGFWRMEHTMQKFPNEAGRCTAAQLLAVVIGSALYCAIAEGGAHMDGNQLREWFSDPYVVGLIAWTGIASTALSVYMETRALQTLSATEATLLLSTEPLWGSAFAALVIGEQFGVDAAVGGALILAGCLYSNLGLDGLRKSMIVPLTNTFVSITGNGGSTSRHDKGKKNVWWLPSWVSHLQQ